MPSRFQLTTRWPWSVGTLVGAGVDDTWAVCGDDHTRRASIATSHQHANSATYGRHEEEKADGARDEAGNHHQQPRGEKEHAVEYLAAGRFASGQLFLQPAPHANALPLHQPTTEHADADDREKRGAEPDGVRHLDEYVQLENRNQDEK